MDSLERLPEKIVESIIGYLPQQAKLNLLYTNYHFYSLVQPILYKRLLFTKSTVLHSSNDFRDSELTIIGTSESPLASNNLNEKIYKSRQEVLLQALIINVDLCKFVEEIILYGSDSVNGTLETISDVINPKLLKNIELNCHNLKRFPMLNIYKTCIHLPNLQRVDINDLNHLKQIISFPVTHLYINKSANDLKTFGSLPRNDIFRFFENLESLIFNDELSETTILQYLTTEFLDKKFKFKNLKLIYYHGVTDYNIESKKLIPLFLDMLDLSILKKLEIVTGCDQMACDCPEEFLDYIIKKDLCISSLSILQKTVYRDHNYSEKFDYNINRLLQRFPGKESIQYLSIRHSPPPDFNVGNGFEGNYIKRRTLYEETLPLLTGLETLIAPTFLQSLACYEQLMSDMLWNGCECSHCQDYLPLFDGYVMKHQYYDEYSGHLKDVISPILFGNVGKVLMDRLIKDCDISLLRYPPLNKYWDFHTCVHEIGHFEECPSGCPFDATGFKPITKCISHFLREYAKEIGSMIPGLKLCVLSGEFFDRIGSEWVCAYD